MPFGSDYAIRRIETKAVHAISLISAVAPGNSTFIAGDAFPHSRSMVLTNGDPDAELSEWTRRRQFGTQELFERRAWGDAE
jgi:hypothetical protein